MWVRPACGQLKITAVTASCPAARQAAAIARESTAANSERRPSRSDGSEGVEETQSVADECM
jgi:hypothetical protein